MKKEQVDEVITNFHLDIHNLYEDWDRGKIGNQVVVEKITNLCFYFLRQLIEDVPEF